LHSAEGPHIEQSAILARKRDTLGHALIDDVAADLRQAIDVRLTRTKISALNRVVEKAEDAVPVITVVRGGIDAALRGDRMCAARAVVERKAIDAVALLAERSSGRRPGEAGAHNHNGVLAAVGGIHQLHLEAALFPLLFNWTR